MAGNSRPKKKYRPKVARNPIAAFRVLNRSHVDACVLRDYDVALDEGQQRDISIGYGIAIDRMSKGVGSQDDLGTVAFMCNVALVLCERDFGEQYFDEVKLAQHALWRADQRHKAGKSLAFDAVGLQAIRRVYALHTAQIEAAGQGHLLAAGQEVNRRRLAGEMFLPEHASQIAA